MDTIKITGGCRVTSNVWKIKVLTDGKLNTLTIVYPEKMTTHEVLKNAESKFGIERVIMVWSDDLPE